MMPLKQQTHISCHVKRQHRLCSYVRACAARLTVAAGQRLCPESSAHPDPVLSYTATAYQALYRANIAAYHRVDPAGVAAGARARYGPVYGPRCTRVPHLALPCPLFINCYLRGYAGVLWRGYIITNCVMGALFYCGPYDQAIYHYIFLS